MSEAPLSVDVVRELLETVVIRSPLHTTWGIEVPLPSNERANVHVSFWVRLAETILGDRGWRPHYVWGDIKARDKQSLFLFFRPITPSFYSFLMGDETNTGVVINLSDEVNLTLGLL